MTALSELNLATIRQAFDLFRTEDGSRPSRQAEVCASYIPHLLSEIGRMSEYLADAWLILDGVARSESIDVGTRTAAAALLKRQNVPGWRRPVRPRTKRAPTSMTEAEGEELEGEDTDDEESAD